jgi:hypothetical protein
LIHPILHFLGFEQPQILIVSRAETALVDSTMATKLCTHPERFPSVIKKWIEHGGKRLQKLFFHELPMLIVLNVTFSALQPLAFAAPLYSAQN